MPPYSTLRTFIDALRTGETNITQCLENVTNNRALRDAHLAEVQTPNAFDGALPQWLCDALDQAGMSNDEIRHIERWPAREKEIVRQQVALSIGDNRTLRYGWELQDGDAPVSDVRVQNSNEAVIIFRSPRSGVHLKTVNFGFVDIEA
ncbi:MAG: hypothetical protein WD904_03015 [Dehalococcoidia bacterium]